MYIDWDSNQVVTTLETSTLDINKIAFPAVTICSGGYFAQGINYELEEQFQKFLTQCVPDQLKVIKQ